ncbi:hypothetical protein [Microbacterium laevaniformans]|uniref:hypothetical protein n=1 Tax=Microbacterium laevaniformans TaxID=36807 RepID=UPI003D9760B7
MSHPAKSPISTKVPDTAATREIMVRLCDLWDSSLDGEAIYRPELDAPRAVSIRTQTHHAVRVCRAILQIEPTLRGIEIVPLARLVFECAITSTWLLLTPGAGNALIRDGAGQRLKALRSAAMAQDGSAAAIAESERVLKELEDAGGPGSYAFEQRCLALDGGESLYLTYRALSAESHAGLGLADFYSVKDNRSAIGVSFNPLAQSSVYEATFGITACMLLLAINADELGRDKPHRTTQIARAAKRLGVEPRIVGKGGYELPPRGSDRGN